MDVRGRPSWLDEPCPPWCSRDHAEEDHPEDRYHRSEPSVLTGTAGDGDAVPVTATLRPTSLGVWLGRYVGDHTTWLAIESLESRSPRLVLAVPTAVALLQGLAHQLADPDPSGLSPRRG